MDRRVSPRTRVTAHDLAGEVLWSEDFVPRFEGTVEVRGLAVAPDGGIVVGGMYQIDGAFVRKYASTGALLWHRDLSLGESPIGPAFEMWGLACGRDSTIYLAGSYLHDMVVMAMDP
jgi:outer membrane protein assembly factor BamB